VDAVEEAVREYLKGQETPSATLDRAADAVAKKLAADKHHVRQRIWRLHEFGRTVEVIRDPDGSHAVRLLTT
jgi:hypothetical protein